MFGNIGVPELIIIFAIALLIFGPKKLPEVGRSIGRALREFRKTSDEIKNKIEEEIQAEEFREIKNDIEDLGNISDDKNTKEETPSQKEKETTEDSDKKDIKDEKEGKKVT